MPESHRILLGTHDFYIHTVEFNPTQKTLKHTHTTRTAEHPSWLTAHPTLKDIIYANGHVDGKIFCMRVKTDGSLETLDKAVSGGMGPTHLAVSTDNSNLLIAHYGKKDASLASLPIDPLTGRFKATFTKESDHFVPPYTPSSHPRFEAPHVHQVLVHQDEVITCDLGNNKIWRLVRDEHTEGWKVKGVIEDFEPGDGPRHATIHPNGKYIYVLNEVSSTLTVHTLPSSGPSKLIYRHTTLPPSDTLNKEMTGSEILLLPSLSGDPTGESLLILTNRFSHNPKGDSMALFAVSPDGGLVKPTEERHYYGIGKHIRGLGADRSGRWVVAAGRDEGGVVILERVGNGLKLEEVARVDIPHVVVPLWL